MKKIIFISLLTSTLFAQEKENVSEFFVAHDVREVSHESTFGTRNTYSLLFAKHQFSADDQDLHFFYGAKMGLLSEEHYGEDVFGIPLNKVGAYYAAAVGLQYDTSKSGMVLAEGVRSQDLLHSRSDSKLRLSFNYTY
jgi:hypothetical protein